MVVPVDNTTLEYTSLQMSMSRIVVLWEGSVVSDREDVPVWELVGYRLDRHIRARKRSASTVTGSSVFGKNNNSS